MNKIKFLDNNSLKDEINFLSTKFSSLILESNNLPKNEVQNSPFSKERIFQMINDLLSCEIYSILLYKNKYNANLQRQWDLNELHKHNMRYPASTVFNEFFYNKKSNYNLRIIDDIVLAAHHIDDILIKNRHAPIIFIGRTPCFIQLAYEQLCSIKYPNIDLKNHIIHLNFSGTPDAINLRNSPDYQDKNNNIIHNMVTPKKLKFYENYLTEKGLNNITNCYIVDMMGTGGNLNSFLRIIRHYYQITLKKDVPNIHFICLSQTMGSDHKLPIDTWYLNQKLHLLKFNSCPEYGIIPIEISITSIQLSNSTLEKFLDNDLVQKIGTHGIEFFPQKWRKEYKSELQQGGIWHKEIYELLRPHLRKLLIDNENILRNERDKLID